MEEAERRALAQGQTLADFSLPVATSSVKQERVAQQALAAQQAQLAQPSVETTHITAPQMEYPTRFKGSAAPEVFGKTASGYDAVTTETFAEREIDSDPIRLLKEDDWIKQQPWAESQSLPDGKTVWYTKQMDLPYGMYEPDKYVKVEGNPSESQVYLKAGGFGAKTP